MTHSSKASDHAGDEHFYRDLVLTWRAGSAEGFLGALTDLQECANVNGGCKMDDFSPALPPVPDEISDNHTVRNIYRRALEWGQTQLIMAVKRSVGEMITPDKLAPKMLSILRLRDDFNMTGLGVALANELHHQLGEAKG